MHQNAQPDAQAFISDQVFLPGLTDAGPLRDTSDPQSGLQQALAGQERATSAQEPAILASSSSARSGWDRTGRLVGEGNAEPHYKPGVPRPRRGMPQSQHAV